MSSAPAATLPRRSYVLGPVADFAFLIATPLAILPVFQLLLGILPLGALKMAVLGVSATGHHLPGLIRAYTDEGIFRQFRLRLLVVPALLVLMTALAAWFKLSLAFFVLIMWSTWHGSMQILGFLRIYDLKAGIHSRLAGRLDFWICLAWFVQVVLWSTARKTSVFSSFYLAGGPLLSAPLARAFEAVWLALTAAVTIAYVAHTAWLAAKRGYFNPMKLLCLGASVGFWGYCMTSAGNLIIGLILWEVFHDLQYNVFVWRYNRNRVAGGLSRSPLERFLFQARPGRIIFYALCIAAYGCLGLLSLDLVNIYQNEKTYANAWFQLGNVFAASGLIHFYLDGFIWKVRDAKVQRDLGLVSSQAEFHRRPSWRHGAMVAAFFSVCAGLGWSEYHHLNAKGGNPLDNLVELVPESGYANFMKASSLKAAGKPDSALAYYERAVRFDTNYAFSQAYIADLKVELGDLPGAASAYEKALALDPESELLRGNLAGLRLRLGDYAQARALFQALAERFPANAEYAYQVAFSLLQQKKGLEAKPWLEKTLALDPGQPRALNYLGMVEQVTGNMDAARALYLRSLALDSTYLQARQNLATLAP